MRGLVYITKGKHTTPLLRGQARIVLRYSLISATALSDHASAHIVLRYCNTPKYTLVVFDMFRVFCKHNLTVLRVKCETRKRETRNVTKLKDKIVICPKRGLKDMD